MLWFIITTGKCNLKCLYCGGSFPEKYVPYKPMYSIEDLKNFLLRYDNDITICFYGGEPLLNIDFIIEIIENINANRFVIQTNATLIKDLDIKYWYKFSKVLVSIDGIEEITDKYRGKGVYKKVIENVLWLRKQGFKGKILARMTVTEDTDIYRDVLHLLKLNIFNEIHWQLNVVWCEPWNVSEWAERKYLPGLKELAKLFIENIIQGNVIRIIPFIGVLNAILIKPFNYIPCGAGRYAFTINTNGKIYACPIAFREEWALVGNLNLGIERIFNLPEKCKNCNYVNYCGGRCLYMHMEKLWSNDMIDEVCNITKKFIDIVFKIVPYVKYALENNLITINDILHNPLHDSTEVIP